MKKRYLILPLILLLALPLLVWPQAGLELTKAILESASQAFAPAGTWSFSGKLKIPGSTTPPSADCDEAAETGRIYYDSDAQIGQRLHECRGTLGWYQVASNHTGASSAVHGLGGTVVGTSDTQTITNKTIDGGAVVGIEPPYSRPSGGNILGVLTHAEDCTALAFGKARELCYEADADTLYACEPTAGDCDTAAEWRSVGGGGGIPASIVDVKGDLIAATGADTVVRLPVGADGTVLEADSSQSAGLRMRYIDWTVWSSIGGWQNMLGSNTGQAWTANRVWCARMIVPQGTRLPADSIVYNVTTSDAGNDLAACIYDDAGTSLLASNNNCSTAATGTVVCSLTYTATAGAYSVCITSASSTLAIGRLSDSRPLPMTRSIGYQTGGGTTCPATITYPYVTQETNSIPYIWRLEDRQ